MTRSAVMNATDGVGAAKDDQLAPGLEEPSPDGAEEQLRVTVIGPTAGTSLHRARALERLGHRVTLLDPWEWLGRSKWVGRWLHHAGGIGSGLIINRRLYQAVAATTPDLIFVNQGEFLGPGLIRRLRELGAPIINYTPDNPFSEQQYRRFRAYRKAIPYYDLLAVTFEENVAQARAAGARDVVRVWHPADEVAHAPRELTDEERRYYASEVAFVGTWMEERGRFLAELIRRGIPVAIWGDRWPKAPEWPELAPYWRGPAIGEEEYARVIQSAKIALGLLNKGSRNLHTHRSTEIPALGGLLCAERTSEHQALYEEDREAVFWTDAKECASLCKALLENEPKRMDIAEMGRRRIQKHNLFNEPTISKLIRYVWQ